MTPEFSNYARNRMAARNITEEEVPECLRNHQNSYQGSNFIVYAYHDRYEKVLKVRVTGEVITDVFRVGVE
jgi:hypothetical protein